MVLSKSTPMHRGMSLIPQGDERPPDAALLQGGQRLVDLFQAKRRRLNRPRVEGAELHQPRVARKIAVRTAVATPGAAQLLALVQLLRVDDQRLALPRVADDDREAALAAVAGQRLRHLLGSARRLPRDYAAA